MYARVARVNKSKQLFTISQSRARVRRAAPLSRPNPQARVVRSARACCVRVVRFLAF